MRKLPHLSGREIVGALERLGFQVVRRRGSHIVMRRFTVGCAVPDHREVKVGTLAGILKQACVTADEFLDSLQ
jgi:predicted RNA binding protein YcfA (HicA-like mRNA interferase family)